MALPGVNTTIRDRFIFISRTDIPIGPRVLVIGTRDTADGTDGVQDLDPYNIQNEQKAIDAFGEGSQVHRAYLECVSGGAQRVTVVALPSDTVFDHTNGEISSADYTTANPTGDLFDDAFAAAEAARPDIIVPWGRGVSPLEYEDPATPGNSPEIGFHADNSITGSKSWAVKVANKCAEITANSHPVFAVMGVKPYNSGLDDSGGTKPESMRPSEVATHVALDDLIARKSASFGTNGIYLSIVAAEIAPLGYYDDYGYSNGACMYAGHITQLDSWSSPTSKTIYNVASLRYNPTRTQQQAMIDLGVVPVTLDFNRTPIWRDAQTFSQEGSDYARLTTLRIVFDAVLLVRQVSEKFIGEAATLENRNALETAITAGLRGMQQLGALYSADHVVTYVPAENKAIVDMVLNPAFELRNIEVSVSIQI